MERARKTEAEGVFIFNGPTHTNFIGPGSSDTWEATLAIPSTLIGGRDVEKDQRLRLDGLESMAKTNKVGSVSRT
ncbi:hypothetical protein Tco_0872939 [Tanacetum coccineum]